MTDAETGAAPATKVEAYCDAFLGLDGRGTVVVTVWATRLATSGGRRWRRRVSVPPGARLRLTPLDAEIVAVRQVHPHERELAGTPVADSLDFPLGDVPANDTFNCAFEFRILRSTVGDLFNACHVAVLLPDDTVVAESSIEVVSEDVASAYVRGRYALTRLDPAASVGPVAVRRALMVGLHALEAGDHAAAMATLAKAATWARESGNDDSARLLSRMVAVIGSGGGEVLDRDRRLSKLPRPVPVVPGAQPVAPHEVEGLEDRLLQVGVAGTLADEQVVVLTTLALADFAPPPGPAAQRSDRFPVDPAQVVIIHASYRGFEAENETFVPVELEPGRHSATVAFRFRVLPEGPHHVGIAAIQGGRELGRVVIDDFGSLPRPVRLDPSCPPVDVLMKVCSTGELFLTTNDLRRVSVLCEQKLPVDAPGRVALDRYFRLLTDEIPPERLERELLLIGKEVAAALPSELVELFATSDDLSILIDHPGDLDFPFELALLERADGARLLGEVHRVTRWISPGPRPDHRAPPVAQAAVVYDAESLAEADEALQAHCAAMAAVCVTRSFDDLDIVRSQVFQKADFGLIHLVGHLEAKPDGSAGLRVRDQFLRPGDFLRDDRRFGSAAALVFVNACSSVRTARRFFEPTSFPQELIGFEVRSVIATVLPVEPSLALEFGTCLLHALANGTSLGESLRVARQSFLVGYDKAPRVRRRMAAVAYSGFGHPGLTMAFSAEGDSDG